LHGDEDVADAARRIVLLGAAGRDFHNFNVRYRHDAASRVVAFTAAQIPGIDSRTYPAALAGPLYPEGIPIVPERDLEALIRERHVDEVVFAYSDVSHRHVMHLACTALAAGASFRLLGPRDTMLPTPVPTVAVLASRTGAGKSTIARYVVRALRGARLRTVVVRHPMPYGPLDRGVERYARLEDLSAHALSVEELEEYEPHVDAGSVVYAGVDYAEVLARAAAEADVLVWDGGNNDMSFFVPALTVTALDPTRPGEEDDYFPGEVNVRAADVLVLAKANAAAASALHETKQRVRTLNAHAPIVEMDFVATVKQAEHVRGRRVLVVEDGPSLTHGHLREGAGAAAARDLDAELIDPRPYAVGSLAEAYARFPAMGPVLPALGYSAAQREELRETIARVPCDTVLLGTPIDLARLLPIDKPVTRVDVQARDRSGLSLAALLLERFAAPGARR
jgi:predicted GTPase